MSKRAPVLTPQTQDFPRWYQDVIAKAELADNGPVRGTMVIRPYGYGIWELMKSEMDRRIKLTGASNAYFPLFIPQAHLQREAEHVEGFSPELAVVTTAGGKQLEEAIVVRPTSETIIGQYMAKWVLSHRDLPLLLNQWANVVRWEMRPRLFLRTTEFLWQEGHSAHATQAEAATYASRILNDVYADFMINELAAPVFVGRKTPAERFAGAVNTMTCEAITRDGKALQMGTSHELGQNFARAFDINFLTSAGERKFAWTTSWGTSTRMVGGLIMIHGDNDGLRLPPRVAPIQTVVLAIKPDVVELAARIADDLKAAGTRVLLDDRTDISFGRRAIDWELKGVPTRIELGPRDIAAEKAVLVDRTNGTRTSIPLPGIVRSVTGCLDAAQVTLLNEARTLRDDRVADVSDLGHAREACEAGGWARIPWSLVIGIGEKELAEHGISVRCLQDADGGIPLSDDDPDLYALVARAY
jgi:prolyl-tRNA synthetase, family I